jgi:sortase (surface protein transpeptidase)
LIVRIRHRKWPRFAPWRFAQWILLIVGVLTTGYAGFSYAARYVYQAYEIRVFDGALALQLTNSLTPRYSVQGSQGRVTAGSLVGKIEIHRLGISAIVREGVDGLTLGLAVGHVPSTVLPGEMGNSGVG